MQWHVPGVAAAVDDGASEHTDFSDDFRDFTGVFGFGSGAEVVGVSAFSGATSIVLGAFSLNRELDREAPFDGAFDVAFDVDFDDAFEVDFDAAFDDFVLFLTGCGDFSAGGDFSGGVAFTVVFSDSN